MAYVMQVWYVVGDPDNLLFKDKLDAESYAREVFPDEDGDKRYARIFYREVHTFKELFQRS